VWATINGTNLASVPANVQVTLNGQAMTLQPGGVSPTQIKFLIPANFPTGVFELDVNNGSIAANPFAVEIDVPPPTITSVTNSSGVAYNAVNLAAAHDQVDVYVLALDPAVIANWQDRVRVTLAGQPMTILSVAPAPNGQTTITFQVGQQSFGGVPVNLAVVVDGSSSVPVQLPVQ
jgi:uncharacterized protein (TIGR03437 family)